MGFNEKAAKIYQSMYYSIPKQYRIGLVGKYNAGCTTCIECDAKLGFNAIKKTSTLIGFSRTDIGIMQVHECKKCFMKQYFHIRTQDFLNHLIELLNDFQS
jgi:hypothetical protein